MAGVYGPPKQGRIFSFLKLNPQYFKIEGSGPNLKRFPSSSPESRMARPRPVQDGGASGSAAPAEPRERQPRTLEIDPRAIYRRFQNDQRVEYKDENPARINTPRFRRYEAYQVAATIGGARRLGATSQDVSQDLAAGAQTLL